MGEGVEIPNLDESNDQMVVNVITPKEIVEEEPIIEDEAEGEAEGEDASTDQVTQHQKMRQLKAKILLKKHQLNNWYKLKKSFSGLRNPGSKYDLQRHNVGKDYILSLAKDLKAPMSTNKNTLASTLNLIMDYFIGMQVNLT